MKGERNKIKVRDRDVMQYFLGKTVLWRPLFSSILSEVRCMSEVCEVSE